MAPKQIMIAAVACGMSALFGGAEGGLVNNKDMAVSLTSQHHVTTQTGSASFASSSSASTLKMATLARGSTARNVAAAQYALAANRGFFSWWPSWGWRSFLGWWASWGSKKVDDSIAKRPSKLDAIVDTTHEPKNGKAARVTPATRSFTERSSEDSHDELAADVALDEAGYLSVSSTRSESAMISFMRNTCEKEGLAVIDNETLFDVVKFYDGECATQSYRNLVEELHRAEHPYLCHRAWTAKAGQGNVTDDAALAELVALGGKVITSSSDGGLENVGIGGTATLNERGYQAVAAKKSTPEMMTFIERVLASVHLKVKDRSGLEHFAPYYSSECARQSYSRLLKELKMAPARPQTCGGGWVDEL